jgi:hypothetical protein
VCSYTRLRGSPLKARERAFGHPGCHSDTASHQQAGTGPPWWQPRVGRGPVHEASSSFHRPFVERSKLARLITLKSAAVLPALYLCGFNPLAGLFGPPQCLSPRARPIKSPQEVTQAPPPPGGLRSSGCWCCAGRVAALTPSCPLRPPRMNGEPVNPNPPRGGTSGGLTPHTCPGGLVAQGTKPLSRAVTS